MTVFGIETATSICSAAIVRDARVLSERTLDEKNIHAEKILTLIDEALSTARCTCADGDGIAVSIGPGSFTGLRIGLSVAKGLAYSLGKPLVAVPTLRALAQRVVDGGQADSTRCVLALLDARRDEVYCQCFTANGAELIPLWPERAMTVTDLLDQIRDLNVVVTGDARGKLAGVLAKRAGEGNGRIEFASDATSKCSAATIALLGEAMLAGGRHDDPASLEPLYIKNFYYTQRNTVHNS